MKLSLFLVVLFGVAVCLVHGGCVRKDSLAGMAADILPKKEEDSSVGQFFKDLGCDIADAGRSVKDGVQTGYEYVKKKLTPKTEAEEAADKVKEALDIDLRSKMGS